MSETNLSTYPTTVDTFDRYSDLDAETMAMADIYRGYIDAGQYETAATYLTDNPSLEACGITAEIINKHSDAIVACETYLNDTRTYLNQTTGVVSSLTSSVGTLITDMNTAETNIGTAQSDILELQNNAIITSEEKIIGTIGGFTHCKISKVYTSSYLGTKTSDTMQITDIVPGLGTDGIFRYILNVKGVFYDDGAQAILTYNSGSRFDYVVTTIGSPNISIAYANASTSSNKKMIILIEYLRETA